MPGGGGTDLERGYGDVRPWRPPFHASPAARKAVPFQAKESVHKTPFWENLEILASTAPIFTQILAHKPSNLEIFSSQAPKFGNFQLTSPQIWKFSAHKPPFSEANVSSQAPHFRNPGRTPLPEKKLIAPPPPPGCNAGPAEGPGKNLKYRSNSRLYPTNFSNKLWILIFIILSIWPNFLKVRDGYLL